MAKPKHPFNEMIDNTLAQLADSKTSDGFTYEDAEMRIRTKLGSNLDDTIQILGEKAFRAKIRDRARIMSKDLFKTPVSLHPRLFDEELSPIYPVQRGCGATRFKKVVHMNKEELGEVMSDLKSQQQGISKHLNALENINAQLGRVWDQNPDLTIEEAQSSLDSTAA